ncbi:MAG: peptide deformylase [Clostridia bacterium]|nr:peptide deformylase [Clostridia bacterium]
MVRQIMRDTFFLSQKSAPATQADRAVVQDLIDTVRANADRCAGMAANMIGVHKRIIAFNAGPFAVALINPEIIRREKPYEAEEGCLSLDGVRKTTRYQEIEVRYLDASFKPKKQVYTGWIAQVIQHEIDHCDGILI